MKRNIFVLALISFFTAAGISYLAAENLYKENLKRSLSYLKNYSISIVDSVSPEIKAAFSKSDDIGLLYSVNKLSKFKNVSESFVLDKSMTVVIHNDSSKWNQKYTGPLYKNAVTAKNNLAASLPGNAGFLYSVPIDENNTLCAIVSSNDILNGLESWKIRTYVYGFVISLLFSVLIYYLSKILFLVPFNGTKKALSVKGKMKKTIYSELVDMVMVDVNNLATDLNAASGNSALIKQLFSYVIENCAQIKTDVFAVLDSNAKIIYCSDKDEILFKDKTANTHIFNAVNDTEIIKHISPVLENLEEVSFDNGSLKIEAVPVKNTTGILTGIIITGSKI